jgi:ligand-binding sensor domain-containing protein
MCRFRFVIFLLLSFYAAQDLSAQKSLSYFFRHINQWDGLLNNQVLSITQDGRGFMWIATVGGLQRYDGSGNLFITEMLSNPEEGFLQVLKCAVTKKNLLWITNNALLRKWS